MHAPPCTIDHHTCPGWVAWSTLTCTHSGCMASLHHFLDATPINFSFQQSGRTSRCSAIGAHSPPTYRRTCVPIPLSHVVLVAFVQPYPASGSGQPTLGRRRQCARLPECWYQYCAGGAARDRRADGAPAGPAISIGFRTGFVCGRRRGLSIHRRQQPTRSGRLL